MEHNLLIIFFPKVESLNVNIAKGTNDAKKTKNSR